MLTCHLLGAFYPAQQPQVVRVNLRDSGICFVSGFNIGARPGSELLLFYCRPSERFSLVEPHCGFAGF